MGLYDSYQLKNSREIPQYAGSALPELTKSLELAQQTYDSASTMDQDLAQTVLGTSVLDQDKPTWRALNNKTQAELRDRITKGDYENMYGIVSQRARKTIAALKPLAEQIQRRSSYQQTLDDKELNLDESTKTALKEQSDRKYTGVKFDEQGRAIEGTQYSGLGAVKNIDVNDRIRKAITIANPDAEKVERSGDNGWQTWTRERGWEKLSPEKLANIVNQAYANDTEWQQSDEQKINTSTFHATKHVSDAMVLNFMKANSGTDVAKTLMDKITAGKSPADAYADIQSAAIRKQIRDSRLGYGMGAEFYKGTDKQGSGVGELWLHENKKKIDEPDESPFMVQGPDTKLTDSETDITTLSDNNRKLSTDISTMQEEKTMYEKQLAGAQDASTRAQTEANLNNVNERIANTQIQLSRSNQVLDYSKNRTAQQMGYANGYKEFLKKEGEKIAPVIAKEFPKGIDLSDFEYVGAENIARALVDNRIVTKFNTSASGVNRDVTTIKTEAGRTYTLKPSDVIKLNRIITAVKRDSKSKLNEFNSKLQTNHKTNIKDYSIKSEVIGVGKKDSEDITKVLKGASGGIEFSEPGQFGNIGEDNRPTNYRVIGITPEGTSNNIRFKVEVLDEKDNPTGKFYDAKAINSNIGEILADKWNKSSSNDAKLAGAMIRKGSGARVLLNMSVGEEYSLGEMEITKGNVSPVTIRPTRNPDNTISYIMYDGSGNIVRTETSAGKAGRWIDIHKQLTTPK